MGSARRSTPGSKSRRATRQNPSSWYAHALQSAAREGEGERGRERERDPVHMRCSQATRPHQPLLRVSHCLLCGCGAVVACGHGRGAQGHGFTREREESAHAHREREREGGRGKEGARGEGERERPSGTDEKRRTTDSAKPTRSCPGSFPPSPVEATPWLCVSLCLSLSVHVSLSVTLCGSLSLSLCCRAVAPLCVCSTFGLSQKPPAPTAKSLGQTAVR